MKRIYALALCAVMVLSLAACASAKANGNKELDNDASGEYGKVENSDGFGRGTVQIANPFVDYKTLDAAAQAAGFGLNVPVGAQKGFELANNTNNIRGRYQDDTDPGYFNVYRLRSAGHAIFT